MPLRHVKPVVVALLAATLGFAPLSPLACAGQWSAVEQPKGTKSTDLRHDIREMWQTQKQRNSKASASTDAAIAAAHRVFNTVSLIGKTREEVVGLLGDSRKSNDSQYNFPFWPAPSDAMVYRFDCGSYGWQFNILFDNHDKVKKVERKWIH